jgi:VanZ family protein
LDTSRHRSSATPLAWVYAGLIVYASLYPFTPWRLPGNSTWAFLDLPLSQWWTWFDVVANWFGYIPLGALIFGALVRSGFGAKVSLFTAVVAGSCLSLSIEFTQNFLPQRVPSNLDLAMNSLGVEMGAMLGVWVHLSGGVEWWQAARDRWFITRSAGGLALLLLWPLGLLAPLSVPFGQGQVLTHVSELGVSLVAGTSLEPWLVQWADSRPASKNLSSGAEFILTALGLLTPCLLAFSVSRPGWRRFVLVVFMASLGGFVTTLSTALNFGPQHLLAWGTAPVLAALGFGCLVAAALSFVSMRAATGLGLMALVTLVILVARAPADPYFAQTLQAWEQGRFIRFHGAVRWVGWLWPYAALTYLFVRICDDDDAPRIVR